MHHLPKIGHLQRAQGYTYSLWRLGVVRENACKSKVVERAFIWRNKEKCRRESQM